MILLCLLTFAKTPEDVVADTMQTGQTINKNNNVFNLLFFRKELFYTNIIHISAAHSRHDLRVENRKPILMRRV